ncbi:thiamine diphosphokinase [Sedimentibacter sp. B4]|uniref:thiamine diphosphokinase n=1 Tax=Sedimentibacter sp. B4 TaxID=304766 RepID=UPI0003089150|nr:thiamine diphosphokinase [Sedimentibacter sp. B4]
MVALIIANGDDVDKTSLENINIDYVICADGGLEKAEKLQVVPDLIIGDFDSVHGDVLEKYKRSSEIMKYPAEKDFTDMELSIEIAVKKGFRDILLVGATGGPRLDHSLANMMLLEKYYKLGINIIIVDNNNKIQIISDNCNMLLDKKRETFVSLIPLTEEINGLTLEGFKYPLDRVVVKRGSTLCVSNEIISDNGRIILEGGTALLFISRD